jgi:hypothetical protein
LAEQLLDGAAIEALPEIGRKRALAWSAIGTLPD